MSSGPWAIPPLTRFRKHEHDSAHICFVLDGGFSERERGGWRDVSPGTARVSGAARHDIDFGASGATCLVLQVDDEIPVCGSPRFLEDDARLRRIALSIQQCSVQADPSSKLLAADLTTEFVAQICRRLNGRVAHPPPWLEQVREIIEESGGSVTVGALARYAQVHRVHLARTFHDHFGVSVTRYVRSTRARKALGLIRNTDMNLTWVAAEAGYADQSHLTRELRVFANATPRSLRSMLHPFKTGARPD